MPASRCFPATASLSPPPLPTPSFCADSRSSTSTSAKDSGIYALTAALVGVDRCAISGFGTGILYDATGVGHNGYFGLGAARERKGHLCDGKRHVRPARGFARTHSERPLQRSRDRHPRNVFRTTISDSFIGDHGVGIFAVVTGLATSNISLSIDRTTIVDNVGVGLFAGHTSGPLAVVNLANSTVSGNDLGIVTNGGGYIRVTGTQINGNTTGLSGTGSIVTLGTNLLYGNGANGTFTGSLSPN